jgi:hypothetical protein
MKPTRWIVLMSVLSAGALLLAQTDPPPETKRPHGLSRSKSKALQTMIDAQDADDVNHIMNVSDLLEKSREAGLLTDWHLDGRFGRRSSGFARQYAPEKEAAKQGARHFERRRYELVCPEGIFTLPKELAGMSGVFYAVSSTYLTTGGNWNVYLESGAEAVVFVDGQPAVARGPKATGVLRETIHIESGHHSVLVKFTAKSAPFRVAILPPNSGSRRKNNTPYMQASPTSEDMLALNGGPAMGSTPRTGN